DPAPAARRGLSAARVPLPAGPRVINSTMGVVQPITVPGTGVTINNTFAPDGTRLATGFVIEFDRPVDPSTFTADVVSVVFRNPTTAAPPPGVLLDVLTVL